MSSMTKTIWTMTIATILLAGLVAPAFTNNAYATPTLLGPSEYVEFANSPFFGTDFSSGYFHLEDFEDGFNSPGVSASGTGLCIVPNDLIGTCFWVAVTDSVDEDDGVIDGNGNGGHSHFSSSTGITYTFDEGVLGDLPTHVGIVWTDGGGTVTFEAFDKDGISLGIDTSHSGVNGVWTGETDEDRFYGVIDTDGIKSIFIDNANAGTEADHLQYGFIPPNEAPDCSNIEPSQALLWPPNHKFVPITINGITDGDGDSVTITIDGITQDEEVDAKGKGDGKTSPDGQGVGSDTAEVRAERSGNGDGRVYEISFTADDGNGGSCSGSVEVGVPHNKKSIPVNSGSTIDSTVE